MEDSPQQVSLVKQAIVNLSKILGDFNGNKKNINTQVNQMIDHVGYNLSEPFHEVFEEFIFLYLDVLQGAYVLLVASWTYVVSHEGFR